MPSSCPLAVRQLSECGVAKWQQFWPVFDAAPFPVQKPCADIGIRVQGALPTFNPPRPDAGPVRKGRSPSHAPCIGRCASTVTICGLPDYRVARLRSYPIIGVAERQVAGTPRSWCQALVAPVVRAGVGLPALVPREDGGRAGNRPRRSGPATEHDVGVRRRRVGRQARRRQVRRRDSRE